MKNIIWIVIGMVVAFIILSLIGKGMVQGYKAGAQEETNKDTTQSEIDALLAKGYTLDEAKKIMATQAYKDGNRF